MWIIQIDEGGNGYVNFDELHGLAERLGLPLSSSQDFDDAIAAVRAAPGYTHGNPSSMI